MFPDAVLFFFPLFNSELDSNTFTETTVHKAKSNT